jgi:hypothetical protein
MARPEEEIWACRTFVRWSYSTRDDNGQKYTIKLITPRDPRLGKDFRYDCSCDDSYPCLHVSIAKGYHCGWHEVYDPEKMVDHGVCPRCGEMLIKLPWSK